MFCIHLHVVRVYEVVLRKIDFLRGLCKNEKKIGSGVSLFTMRVLSFLQISRKIFIVHETLREHVECEDIHIYIFF
jgi:hypothetical protein